MRQRSLRQVPDASVPHPLSKSASTRAVSKGPSAGIARTDRYARS